MQVTAYLRSEPQGGSAHYLNPAKAERGCRPGAAAALGQVKSKGGRTRVVVAHPSKSLLPVLVAETGRRAIDLSSYNDIMR
jgi:hypothetical protein